MRYAYGFGLLGLLMAPPMSTAARADAGSSVFHAKCAVCHSAAAGQNRVGPTLFGVVGRPAATIEHYTYSPAMKASGKVWNAASLDVYLTNPHADVPGTKMSFPGIDDAPARASLIAYLTTLH